MNLIVAISKWIDGSRMDDVRPRAELVWELNLWRRCTKVASEAGEVIDALAGVLGENPRKGVTHSLDDLVGELLDVALAALAAV